MAEIYSKYGRITELGDKVTKTLYQELKPIFEALIELGLDDMQAAYLIMSEVDSIATMYRASLSAAHARECRNVKDVVKQENTEDNASNEATVSSLLQME